MSLRTFTSIPIRPNPFPHPSPSTLQTQTRTLIIRHGAKHSLRNNKCIITGASRGIGRAIAIAFARSGASCLLVGRDQSALLETQSLCTTSFSRPQVIKIGDVSDRNFWKELDLKVDLPGSDGRVDTLVHAAGVTHSSVLFRTSARQIENVVQTNLMGAIWGSQIVAKAMLKNGSPGQKTPDAKRGHVLFISSLLATHGGTGSAAYSASKAGVLGLTRSLAAEMGPAGIRFNAICPGYIETDMTAAMAHVDREKALSRVPAARFGTVDEVADAAVFLAGNEYANNCVINLDGGLSAV